MSDPTGCTDIDPKSEDVLAKPRRRRRRGQAAPAAHLVAGKAGALSRARRRPLSPGIMYEREGGEYLATSPHADLDLWELQLADAFATRSGSVIRSFVDGLKRLCTLAWDESNQDWKPNETELNAALAMVADAQPRNVAEAALAAQMVAVHLMTMRLAEQALNRGGMIMEKDAALASKFARTYVVQIEAMQGLKGKPRATRQTITVKKELHQSVHYHDHRGSEENDAQSHGRTGSHPSEIADQRHALPGPDQGGRIVPLPSRARKA